MATIPFLSSGSNAINLFLDLKNAVGLNDLHYLQDCKTF